MGFLTSPLLLFLLQAVPSLALPQPLVINTPQAIPASGFISNCQGFAPAATGDACDLLAGRQHIPIADFLAYNPMLGTASGPACNQKLIAGDWYCIKTLDGSEGSTATATLSVTDKTTKTAAPTSPASASPGLPQGSAQSAVPAGTKPASGASASSSSSHPPQAPPFSGDAPKSSSTPGSASSSSKQEGVAPAASSSSLTPDSTLTITSTPPRSTSTFTSTSVVLAKAEPVLSNPPPLPHPPTTTSTPPPASPSPTPAPPPPSSTEPVSSTSPPPAPATTEVPTPVYEPDVCKESSIVNNLCYNAFRQFLAGEGFNIGQYRSFCTSYMKVINPATGGNQIKNIPSRLASSCKLPYEMSQYCYCFTSQLIYGAWWGAHPPASWYFD